MVSYLFQLTVRAEHFKHDLYLYVDSMSQNSIEWNQINMFGCCLRTQLIFSVRRQRKLIC